MPCEYALPKPHQAEVAAQFKAESGGPAAQANAREATATMMVGYARPMRELIAVMSQCIFILENTFSIIKMFWEIKEIL